MPINARNSLVALVTPDRMVTIQQYHVLKTGSSSIPNQSGSTRAGGPFFSATGRLNIAHRDTDEAFTPGEGYHTGACEPLAAVQCLQGVISESSFCPPQ